MCIRIQKDSICMLKILQSMSEFGELGKQQKNPACTETTVMASFVYVFVRGQADL